MVVQSMIGVKVLVVSVGVWRVCVRVLVVGVRVLSVGVGIVASPTDPGNLQLRTPLCRGDTRVADAHSGEGLLLPFPFHPAILRTTHDK
eukprot:8822105-Pyramimonas_sp.AAC.1